MDAALQQMQGTNAPAEVINLVRSWYNQAQQAAAMGNYDNALRFLQRAQTYIQAFTTPIQ